MSKQSILTNFNKIVCFSEAQKFQLIKDQDEINRMIENDEINDGDLVIDLNEDNLKLATQIKFIELK